MALSSRPETQTGAGHGIVLVRGTHKASARWLRRSLVAVDVVGLPGWTAVCLAEDKAHTAPPYDKGLEVLMARPVPGRKRPSIGLFVTEGCAVVTVQTRGWRADQRWLVWEPGAGVRRTADLPALPASTIVEAAGVREVTPAQVADHFKDAAGDPVDVLVDLMRLLDLPGADLLKGRGVTPGRGDRVEPSGRAVAAFDRLVADEDDEDEPSLGDPRRAEAGRSGTPAQATLSVEPDRAASSSRPDDTQPEEAETDHDEPRDGSGEASR